MPNRWFLVVASVFWCLLDASSFAQRSNGNLQFEDYPVANVSPQKPVELKLSDPVHRMYRTRIGEGLEKGWGAFREGSGSGRA